MKSTRKPIFMIHKHHASKLHYDLRLEIDGTLVSFAMYTLPSHASQPIRATRVPDHPFWYRHFEGVIPEGEYGAGPVLIWDKGLYATFLKDHRGKNISLSESLKQGLLVLWLEGHKLKGGYILVRISKKAKWLFIKMDDEYADTIKYITRQQRSVKSDKTIQQIAQEDVIKHQK